MLETSKDVLNLVLGLSVFMVAVVFSWVMYQIGKTLKGVNETIKGVQSIVANIDEGVEAFKSKAGNAAAFLTVFAKTAQSLVKTVNTKKKSRARKTSNKK